MSKTSGNVVNPLDLIDDVGLDGFRYYVLADTAYGADGDFSYEGLVGRYNSDLANNLGNLASPASLRSSARSAMAIGTAPAGESPLAAVAAAPPTPRARRSGTRCSRAAPWTPRGQLIRATNAHLEAHEPWKADPGPRCRRSHG